MAEAARDASVETLPASPTFVAVRIGVIALLIPIFWLWLGTVAAVAIAVVLAPLLALFAPARLSSTTRAFEWFRPCRAGKFSGARRHRAPVRLGCAEKRRRWH
jgi:hypothetical protein